jgi:DNA polymerase IV
MLPMPEVQVLFVDMDAYFASVEQMDHPHLRGRPVGVTPVLAASGCCIATSYEARAMGVKTGCRVKDARALCPGIVIVQSRPDRYVRVHHELLAAIDTVLPVSEVESVDECWCSLMANERPPEVAQLLGRKIKAAIRDRIGVLTCSIGIAPNRLLAKVAAGMNKPDGITLLKRSELPGPLLELSLTDLPGISNGINRRLRASGITSIEDLYQRTPEQLRAAWGSVIGEYWWHWLRGEQVFGPRTHRRTVGHQHVLPPAHRSPDNARAVSLRLLAKATQRMRSLGYRATRLSLFVHLMGGGSWGDWTAVHATDDTVDLHRVLLAMWIEVPQRDALQVGVRLEGLEPLDAQLTLFEEEGHRRDLMKAIDRINLRYGADVVYLGAMHHARGTAPRRIPFGAPPDLALPDIDGSG